MLVRNRTWIIIGLLILLGVGLFIACRNETEKGADEGTVVITETVVQEATVAVTRVVVETVLETVEVEESELYQPKNLVVCQGEEPKTLFRFGNDASAIAIQHAIYENDITMLSYGYQAHALEKLPNLADGDALINQVESRVGDTVLDVNGNVVKLKKGVQVVTSDGETVVFDGTPVTMEQMVVDFTMKPTVWSDGRPVTAEDSVYGYKLYAHPATPGDKSTIERTASYEATGPLRIRWTGVPGFLDRHYFLNFWHPEPRHVLEGSTGAELLVAEDGRRLPVGNGPFQIVEWIPGDSIRLVRNKNYYRAGEGLPYLDSVTFRFIPDSDQLVVQLLSGQCDIGTQDGVSVDQSQFLIEAGQNGLLVPYFQTGTIFEHIAFGIDPYGSYANRRPDWFEDVRVRQAMVMCTNRQRMVDEILFGRSQVIHTYIPPSHPLYAQDARQWPSDVAQANQLLDEAGYSERDEAGFRLHPVSGDRFSVTLGTGAGNEMRQQVIQMFKEDMVACGIEVTLYSLPTEQWFAQEDEGPLFGRRFDLGELGWLAEFDPACYLFASWEIPGPVDEINPKSDLAYGGWDGVNETGWVNEAFDEACRTAISSLPGTPQYEESHKEAQRIFAENVPVIPLFLRLRVAAARPQVINFGVDPTQPSSLWNIYAIDMQN